MSRVLPRIVPHLLLITLTATTMPAQGARRVLHRDTVIDGIPCAPTGRASAEWHANGRLLECPVARDVVIDGVTLPRGSWPLLHPDGALHGAWLSRDSELSGHVCRGAGYKKWSVRFFRGGALRTCFLPDSASTIEGVPCVPASFWNEVRGGGRSTAVFHANGRLLQCQAARAFTTNGHRYTKWSVVRRDSLGRAAAPAARSPS